MPPALRAEAHDATTIRRLERAWNDAFLSGDTAFEQCLLLPDFRQINRDGSVTALPEELALAARNQHHPTRTGFMPIVHVIIHGDVAVAYGSVTTKTGRHRVWADYYIWEDHVWRVYFAQQTGY
jgi:hypothetical protein